MRTASSRSMYATRLCAPGEPAPRAWPRRSRAPCALRAAAAGLPAVRRPRRPASAWPRGATGAPGGRRPRARGRPGAAPRRAPSRAPLSASRRIVVGPGEAGAERADGYSARRNAARDRPRPDRAPDVRDLLRARLPRLGRGDRAPPARAREAARLDLRAGLRGVDRRPRRVADRLPAPELGRGVGRPTGQHLLRDGAGVVRRRRGWRARG